jgi:hypothetical protein
MHRPDGGEVGTLGSELPGHNCAPQVLINSVHAPRVDPYLVQVVTDGPVHQHTMRWNLTARANEYSSTNATLHPAHGELAPSGLSLFPGTKSTGGNQLQVADLVSSTDIVPQSEGNSHAHEQSEYTTPCPSPESKRHSEMAAFTNRVRRGHKTVALAPRAEAPLPVISEHFTTTVQVNGRDAVALIDTGANGNMMSPLFASVAEVSPKMSRQNISVTVADG